MDNDSIFFAFASKPEAIGAVIQAAIAKIALRGMSVHPWTENDVSGKPLIAPIFSNIDKAPFVIADVTRPNFNVFFEIGYAIGTKKGTLGMQYWNC